MRTSAIAELDGRLHAFRAGITATAGWTDRQPMTAMLGMIRARYQDTGRSQNHVLMLELIMHFMRTGMVSRPRDIPLLCLGAGWLDEQGKGILADGKLRRKLLTLAATTTGRRPRLKAFRNLLHAYWAFPLHDDATPAQAVGGWQELRDWLRLRHAEISRLPTRKPTWFTMLSRHRHLLDEHPCARYAKSILRDNLDELQQVIDCLLIPAESWLKPEAVMAQIDAASLWQDEAFRAVLPGLLKLSTGEAGIRLSARVMRQAIAKLVMRYARQKQHDPDPDLFMRAVEKIGNPWRQQAAWDALVCNEDGNPCALSRQMINSWLKDRMIETFFADGGQDESRSDFWRKYSVFMQSITVAVKAQQARDQALLARIGAYVVVVPHNRGTLVEIYPWQAFADSGGAALLDGDQTDSARVQQVLARCEPAIRVSQTNPELCDKLLRGILFAPDGSRLIRENAPP